ncbi:MAG: hypothetical protein ACE5IJ_04845, partial [Thermoplasmata archaeon]
MRLPKKNVGEDYGMRSMALLLSATVALSVVTPLAVVFGLNAMTQPTSVGGFPDVPDYEGLLVTLPSEGEEIQACQAGELVTQLPIDEIRRYLPLEEQQDFLNKHPRSYWPRTYYPPEVYTI